MLSLLTRLASGVRTPRNASQVQVATAKTPQVGTANVTYSAPGLPMMPDWDARSAVEQGYLGHPAVYSAVRTIAETIASLPFRAGKDPSKPGEYNVNAPLAKLLGPAPSGPNPRMSSRALWAWSISQRIVTGRLGWELGRNQAGEIVNLWPLISAAILPIPTQPWKVGLNGQRVATSADERSKYFKGFTYRLPDGDIPLQESQVFYSWRPSQRDPRQAETVMEAARLPISIAIALDRYQWGLLKNGLSAKHMIITPPFAEGSEQRAFEEQFLSDLTGFDNAGRPAFAQYEPDLDASGKPMQANVQVVPLAQTAEQAQLIALMGLVERTIYKAFSVPESQIGDSSQRTYSNAGEEYRTFWTRTILPLTAELADDINTYLAPQLGDEVGWFDLSSVEALKPQKTFQPDTPGNLLTAGVVVRGEIRTDMGLPWDLPGPGVQDEVGPEPVADDPAIAASSSSSGSKRAVVLEHPVIDQIRAITAARAGRIAALRVDETAKAPVATERLMEYWSTGEGGGKIGWGTDGDFDRCRVNLDKYVTKPSELAGLCANLHHRATGAWPGHAAGESKARDAAVETESGTAGLLLPKGPVAKPKPIQAHVFTPSRDRRKCKSCGKGVTAAGHLHTGNKRATAGPDKRRLATYRSADRHTSAMESQLEATLHGLFGQQAKATLSRLGGNRGRQMLRDFRNASPQQPEQPAAQVDAARIFDKAFWTTKTLAAVKPVFSGVGSFAPSHVTSHLDDVPNDDTAIANVETFLNARANQLAGQVTQETYDQLIAALNQGVNAGDGSGALAARVKAVFDQADTVRAERIARTEVHGAVSGASDTYAAGLGGAVGKREWLATPDNRTRPAHAAAEGQTRPLGEPFNVGGAALNYPGDPSGPADEVIQCRCVLLYLPA